MSKLIFEKSKEGRRCALLPKWEGEAPALDTSLLRETPPALPEVAEIDLVRHYTNLSRKAYGVENGFYPLGSCTMKYNPKINEDVAAMPGFSEIHPLQPEHTVAGCLEVEALSKQYLCELAGMDAFTMQPAAGAQGEFTALMMIKTYFQDKGIKKTKVLVPDSAHGTNPASAAMCGFEVVTVPSKADGGVDVEKLKELVSDETAALMLTNPSTLGLFEKNIEAIAKIVHDVGGMLYYDGANMNAIMGIVRPGDMGFDVVHINLHKTFSTPHGGGGPGSGPVGCKDILKPYLPGNEKSIGRLRTFHGNFMVNLRGLVYMTSLGGNGLKEVTENAVLNANYMMEKLKAVFKVAYDEPCMHEFVLTLEELKKKTGISAMDVAKNMLDFGIHPPTMYFPLIVHEALMIEPTETESRETIDEAIEVMIGIYNRAFIEPEALQAAPTTTSIGRPDEVGAARNPVVACACL